ncbi:ubiquitin fusion degradation 1 homolog [Olea europaea subsp. europaea]|uniref:Ubiquitin fusion degradation 1 homolog n=1 Tax=Olea europaea subsp. europaea TaxID=158383 RepID=A0A8S0QGG6_OLEEU|nr:ubiquitin fusion degradation 1 homolog [Olea europaea subsp. europaea]
MPVSALNELVDWDVPSPWMFQIKTYSNSGPFRTAVSWDSPQKRAASWCRTRRRACRGRNRSSSRLKLPETAASNPKAVLKNTLSSFSCLSTRDTIMINHNDQKFYINILETKPWPAMCLIRTDCEAGFAAPPDYKESEKPEKS